MVSVSGIGRQFLRPREGGGLDEGDRSLSELRAGGCGSLGLAKLDHAATSLLSHIAELSDYHWKPGQFERFADVDSQVDQVGGVFSPCIFVDHVVPALEPYES